jgi:hypothetical protein
MEDLAFGTVHDRFRQPVAIMGDHEGKKINQGALGYFMFQTITERATHHLVTAP